MNPPLTGSPIAMRSLAYHYIPVVINDPLPGRSVISQLDVYAIGCTSARQFQSPQYFRRHNIFHFSLHCRNIIIIIISFTHVHEYHEEHYLCCV